MAELDVEKKIESRTKKIDVVIRNRNEHVFCSEQREDRIISTSTQSKYLFFWCVKMPVTSEKERKTEESEILD